MNNDIIHKTVSGLLPDAVECLTRLVEIPSESGREGRIATHLDDYFTAMGFETERVPIDDAIRNHPLYCPVLQDVVDSGRFNVVVRLPGKKGGGALVLNAHMDTISADFPEQYRPRIENGRLYGRGACDDKGQIAAVALAFMAIKKMGRLPPAPVELHLTVEEEVGGNGMLALLSEPRNMSRAIVMEPTGMQILTAARGAIWFELFFSGEAAHSGEPANGRSALKMAVEAMTILERYHAGLRERSRNVAPFEGYENPMPLTFGMLQAGRWPAVVPDKAVLKGVMGFLANETAAGLRDEITARMAEAFGGDCRASFTFCRDAGVVNADPALLPDLKKAYLRSGLEPATGAMTSYCDAWFYSSRGVPTAIFGAGSLRSAHTADENVPIGEIAAAAEILVRLALEEGETIMTGENV